MKYKKGYKYQLHETARFLTGISGYVETQFIDLRLGLLTVRAGYAWDGPSGPVIDRRATMRASLVHDALYQLLRHTWLMPSQKDAIDLLFRDMCIEDGVPRWLAVLYYRALRRWGASATDPANKKKIIEIGGDYSMPITNNKGK